MIVRRAAGLLFGAAMSMAMGINAVQAADPVKIGIIIPTSTTLAEQTRRGMDLAVEDLNAAGGILGGRQVELVVYDDQNKPEEGAAATERAINRDGVSVVEGSIFTAQTGVLMAVTKRYDKVFISASAKADSLRQNGYERAFFVNSTVSMDAGKFNDWVADSLKPERIAILAETTDFGEAVIQSVQAKWTGDRAAKIVAIERFDPKETDFSALLTKVKGMNVDVIYLAPGPAETFAAMLKQMDDLKVPGRKLPGPGLMTKGLIDLAGASAEGMVFSDFYSADQTNPENVAFVERFKAKHGYKPDKMELLGYEGVLIPAQAIDKAGADADDAKIAEALVGNTWTTPRGSVKFEKLGASHQAVAGAVLLQVKDGVFVPYKPE